MYIVHIQFQTSFLNVSLYWNIPTIKFCLTSKFIMQCDFSLNLLFHNQEITCWTKQSLSSLKPAQKQNMTLIIDTMGARSAKAQGLPSIITTMSKVISNDHTLYIASSDSEVRGILKMGKKHLFIRNAVGNITEITPLCCLDFYVHESCQREGIGHKLFQRCIQVCFSLSYYKHCKPYYLVQLGHRSSSKENCL